MATADAHDKAKLVTVQNGADTAMRRTIWCALELAYRRVNRFCFLAPTCKETCDLCEHVRSGLTLVLRRGGPRAFDMETRRNPAVACSTLVRPSSRTSELFRQSIRCSA